jgi:hypothetical protein
MTGLFCCLETAFYLTGHTGSSFAKNAAACAFCRKADDRRSISAA